MTSSGSLLERPRPVGLDLPGPSRRITVEPLRRPDPSPQPELPSEPAPQPPPKRQPAREPAPAPAPKEPVPA